MCVIIIVQLAEIKLLDEKDFFSPFLPVLSKVLWNIEYSAIDHSV
jgi:hypothetical protein